MQRGQRPVRGACIVCDAPSNHLVCTDCEGRAGRDLRSIAHLFDRLSEVDDLAAPVASGDDRVGTSGTKIDAPLPLRLAVVNLTGVGGILYVTRRWTLVWALALRAKPPAWLGNPVDQVYTGTAYLIRNLPWAANNRWDFREFSNQFSYLVGQARAVLDPDDRPEPKRVRVGLCPGRPADDHGRGADPCGKPLYASVGALQVECRNCGEVWPRSSWLDLRTG
jgi:hypothetical protein